MSDTVKHGFVYETNGEPVVLASDYDAAVARAEKAEYQIKVLRDLADIDTEARDKLTNRADKLASRIHLLQQHLDATTADRDRWAARAGEAEAERDRLKARGDLYSELAEALGDDPCDSHKSRVEHAKKLKAERDRLAATVERVSKVCLDMPEADSLRKYWQSALASALAEPVEATFPRCRECGKWKQP